MALNLLVLNADGLVLRSLRQSDAGALHHAVRESIHSVGPWLSWCHDGYSLADAENWIVRQADLSQQGAAFEFGIFEHDAPGAAILGCGGLNFIVKPNRTANLGYWLRASATRRGIATRAARRILQYGFDELSLGRIEIVAAVGNLPSIRVAEKLGGQFEAVCRNRLVVGGKSVAARLYSFIPDDFAKAQRP